jgi:hypothetical protein
MYTQTILKDLRTEHGTRPHRMKPKNCLTNQLSDNASPPTISWYTSTAPLPMRYTTMGYTSMRYTSTALYFYEENTQALNKFFYKHFKQKVCK